MTQDQVFVPKTRSQLGLPAFDPTNENILGSSVSDKVKKELWDALGDSPIGATLGAAGYLVRFSCKVFYRVYSFLLAWRLASIPDPQCFWSKAIPCWYQP